MAFAGEEGGGARKLQVFFMPFFATGHIIPMTDLACLFAGRPGVEPTIVTTPANAHLIRPTLDRHAASGCHVHLLLHPFPSVDLPTGVENLSTVSSDECGKIFKAVELCRDIHHKLLMHHIPDAIIADIQYWWTTDIARELGIPHITFHPIGVFPLIVMSNLFKNRVQDNVPNDSHPFTIPDLPGPEIKMVNSELPEFLRPHGLTEAWHDWKRLQLESYGVVVNTFHELEREYCDLFKVVHSQRAWFVGPLALRGKREVEAGFNKERCMRWLEKKEVGSVVFVCFGSWCYFEDEQLRELALGLEGSGMDFIWVVRGGDDENVKNMEWMPEGWEERVKEKGLVVKGWVPQTAILGHEGVGVFMTHCGWNSLLEGLSFGKPLLTWPLIFEQFINERLPVEVLKVGVRVWDGFRSASVNDKVVVPADAIARAMKKFSDSNEEEMKKRALEWKEIAGAAVEEGGSSYKDLNCLIDELLMFHEKKKNGSQ
ncbi:UDP-glucuronosyl/UDP-glucosyltransferase protein [Dioscorea alata]|uniref:UDP-glucuronosyl/UDP-glucosyltransferase protein n=1 Tax=Dioscorea alata TaxID=55571 RepID=A0ACB7U5D1_DIOAL|nr:UDP-glucuronosyl/UDP-glucosyltransferase protein [Dioscorea alata]